MRRVRSVISLIIIKELAAEHGAELSLWKINRRQASLVSALLPQLKVRNIKVSKVKKGHLR